MIDDLDLLLKRIEPAVSDTAREVAETVAALAPEMSAKVRIGWGSVNFHHPAAGFVCAVFPMADHVSLVFEHGRQLSSPLLEGDGKQVRFIRFAPGATIDRDALGILIAEAIALKA